MFQTTGGGVADLHPEPAGPGRLDDDTPPPEDNGSVISLPPLATFTRAAASPVPWESEPRSSSTGRPERSGLLAEAENESLQFSSEGGSRRGGTPPPPEPPVSRAQVAVIGLACFCTFGMGGVVFGISSLYPVLYAQGYWRAICDEAAACVGESTKCCEAQLVRYSLVASVAFFSVDVASAPWGVLADRAGARFCLALAVAISTLGLLLLGGGAAAHSDLITTAALLLLGVAGPGVFNGGYLGGLQLIGEEQPMLRATLTSCLAAVFDGSSSAVFNLAFPIGGLLAALPSSLLLRRAGTRPHAYWGVTAALASSFALLSLLPSYGAQLCAALIFGPIRCLQWACYFQLLADERRYPPHLTGRALGYNNSLIALLGDLLPYLLTFLAASDGWGGDLNGRYLRIKAGLLLLLLLLVLPTAAVIARRALRARAHPPPKMG